VMRQRFNYLIALLNRCRTPSIHKHAEVPRSLVGLPDFKSGVGD
jgi:hypothetical protein